MKIERFEDIEAWKKARELCGYIYKLSVVGDWARDFALRDQIRRAAISVLSNIAEGFERSGDKEFHQFLATAKGSVGEVRAQLYVALDAGYLTCEEFETIATLCLSVSRLIAGLMRYLKNSDYLGPKYKSVDGNDVATLDIGPGTLD
jgi:four helix bundle protein